jgi:tRNA (cmo5U34)-methyltransferase
MKKDEVFKEDGSQSADFEFDDRVAGVFDDMVQRSVPYYVEQQRMICELSRAIWVPGTTVYDLGASTATTLVALSRELPEARLVGYDNSQPMIDQALVKLREENLDGRVELRCKDLNKAVDTLPLDNAGIVTMCWTLQFIRPLYRDHLVRHIYNSLADGGALFVTEKVLGNQGVVNRLFIDFYYDYKRRHGYSEGEISRKREALENVMIPYRIEEDLELFRRCGFEIVETFFQWYNFVGILCIKKPALDR